MEELNYFILQARASGQSDEATRQQLIQAGWSIKQVEAALSPSSAQSLQQPTKNKMRTPLIIGGTVLALLILALIAGGLLNSSKPKISYRTVAIQFITAVRNGNQAKADSLESQPLKAQALKGSGSPSFEKYCKSYGSVCTVYFSSQFVDKAKATYGSYTSPEGTKGESITLSLKDSQLQGSNCSNSSGTMLLTLDLVPSGNSWLIDSVSPDASNNTSCTPT